MEKEIETKLNQFLYALEDFVSSNAEYHIEDLKVVYATQWQTHDGKMFARGLIKVGDAYYSFKLLYNTNTNKLIIKSKIFMFVLTQKEVEEFLAQAVKNGDNS